MTRASEIDWVKLVSAVRGGNADDLEVLQDALRVHCDPWFENLVSFAERFHGSGYPYIVLFQACSKIPEPSAFDTMPLGGMRGLLKPSQAIVHVTGKQLSREVALLNVTMTTSPLRVLPNLSQVLRWPHLLHPGVRFR